MASQYATSDATLDYTVSDQWQDGFVGRMALSSQEGANGWRIAFRLDAEIDAIWNARIISHINDTYVIEGVSYNSSLTAGDTATFGFTARGTDTTIEADSVSIDSTPVETGPVDPDPEEPDPGEPDPVDPAPVDPSPGPGDYVDITSFGNFHGSSSHTGHDELHGGRTAITTEALVAYNGLRNFLGYQNAELETIGQWAFDNDLTNNDQAWGQDLQGVGLYYAMQAAKVGWIRDNAFDPQLLADIQRTARLGDPVDVMTMVEANSHEGFADYLIQNGLVGTFINTLKMEPHYGGWMHGRVHGDLTFPDGDGARAHDVNHLTVLSHDQTQPFMNDTFDWPQWSALDVPHQDVIDYFQSMVILGDPLGDALPDGSAPNPVDPDPVDPDPVDPDPVDPDPVDPASGLSAEFQVVNDWGHGATLNIVVSNDGTEDVSDWDLEFTLGSDIQHIWNAVVESQEGDRYSIDDAGYNAGIGAGETITVGFNTTTGGFDVAQLNEEAQFLF